MLINSSHIRAYTKIVVLAKKKNLIHKGQSKKDLQKHQVLEPAVPM